MQQCVCFIWLSYILEPGNYAFSIDMNINHFSPALRPSTKFLSWPNDPTPRSMIISYSCANIDSKYNDWDHLYCSAPPFLFFKIVLISGNKFLLIFNNLIRCLLCVTVVAIYDNYRAITLFLQDMVIYPFVWRIAPNSL